MHLIKPLWLKHGGEKKDFEAYSCHISPDGLRLVTAAGDGYVRIWSTEAIYNGADIEFTKPRQLAALSYHTGTIHAVRFSPNNKYLASGADDKIVCVYVLDPNAPVHTFGSTEAPPVENWRIYRRLIGHENDVQDLGWSCDASILVSVGLDSRVVIWSGHTFEKLKTISHHGSHVKGICFDPANKYFATASDDRTIKIFRYTSPSPNATAYDQTNNFMLETTISGPFSTSPLTTYFRRCSWSPDGNHIAAANAVNGQVSTAAIIERGTWDSDINLVGHEGPIEVCAFSPRIFSRVPLGKDKDGNDLSRNAPVITVIACAGQDRALSIWNTTSSKPICINENLCMKSISDLAWSPDGESLFFTSLDGSITLVRFAPGELGYPVSLDVNENALAKYGAGRKVGVVEGPEGLLLEEQSKTDELRNVQGRMSDLMGDGQTIASTAEAKLLINGTEPTAVVNGNTEKSTTVNGISAVNGHPATESTEARPAQVSEDPNAARVERLKQRVTITKDGKKRVAPMLISSSAAPGESMLPQTQLVASMNQTKREDAPQSILDLSKPFVGLPKGGLASMLLGNKRKLAETGAEDDNAIGQKVNAMQREGATPILANTTEGLTLPSQAVPQPGEPLRPSLLNSSLMISQMRLAVPMIKPIVTRYLGGPSKALDTAIDSTRPQGSTSGQEATHILEARNPTGPSRTGRVQDREPARITVTKRGQVLWQDFLPKAVSLVTGNARFWAAATEDGSLYVWSPAGRRLFNAFAVEAQPVILDCRGPWLLCISAVGMCYIWNIERAASPHPPISLAPILDVAAHAQGPHLAGGPGIIFARLNSEGRVIVAMSNGEAYAYSPSMYIWQRLSEVWWAVGSQYWNTSVSQGNSSNRSSAAATTDTEENDVVRLENISAGVIPLLERNTTAQTLLRGRAYFLQRLVKSLLSAEGYEGFESGVSVAHLENRLAAALSLGAREEFKVYLSMYAKRLGAEGSKLKIEELLRSLLGGIYSNLLASASTLRVGRNGTLTSAAAATAAADEAKQDGSVANGAIGEVNASGDDEICGWPKETLLREVVLILGRYRDLQRITVPYARLLGLTNPLDGCGNGTGDQEMAE